MKETWLIILFYLMTVGTVVLFMPVVGMWPLVARIFQGTLY